MTDRAREEIFSILENGAMLKALHTGKQLDEAVDQILNLSFNGYTIKKLIELAEKAKEGTNAIDYLKGVQDGYDKAMKTINFTTGMV